MKHISSRILYEDNHLLAFNKRAGEIVQGDKTGDEPLSELLKKYIKMTYGKPGAVFLGVVHRLDRPVSGALLFARTSKALTRLNQMIKSGDISKTYWAVVTKPPPLERDRLVHYLVRNEGQNKSYPYPSQVPGSRKAELIYELKFSGDRYHFLEISLLTGRHHQIRAQLSAIGCPVKGDLKYGAPRSNPDGSIHLHARSVGLLHPVRKETLKVYAPPPEDPLWSLFPLNEG